MIRPQGRSTFYAEATAPPAMVDVYWRYEDEPPMAARLIGRFPPGQKVQVPYNPVGDKNIYLGTITISASGVPSVSSLRDASWTLVVFQRETDAPTVEQVGEATHTLITLSVSGYSQFATKRRIRWADNEAMTVNADEQVIEASSGQPLPVVSHLDRLDVLTTTRSIWVRVSHSSGGDWGDESPAQEITFADNVGSGGTTGEGDPFAGYRFDIN